MYSDHNVQDYSNQIFNQYNQEHIQQVADDGGKHAGHLNNGLFISSYPLWSTESVLTRTDSCSSFASTSSSIATKDKRFLPPPPKQNIMYHPSRYKTELCRQYEELGICEYGDRCLFAHGDFELKPLPHRHPKFKTELCVAYHEDGFCSFGPRCSFIHSKEALPEILEKIQTLPKPPMPENPNSEDTGDVRIRNFLFGNSDFMDNEKFFERKLVQSDGRRLPIFKSFTPMCSSQAAI